MAEENLQLALTIRKDIGDRNGETGSYRYLANVFLSIGDYGKAKEHLDEALTISKEIGDRKGESTAYGNLGNVFFSLGEYGKAKEYFEKALAIATEIGDKRGEASCYGNLGAVYDSLREYRKAKEYVEKSLAMREETGDRKGRGSSYGYLGSLFCSLGEYVKAKENFEKSLLISKAIGHREGEAAAFANLGVVFHYLGEYSKAREYYHEAIGISKEIGNHETELKYHKMLTCDIIWEGNIQKAISNLLACLYKCEDMRGFLTHHDEFNVYFSDEHASLYWKLSELPRHAGNPNKALSVVEFGRARALANLMSTQYGVEKQAFVNPESCVGIESVIEKEKSCTYLYTSYIDSCVFLWILRPNKSAILRQINISDSAVTSESITDLKKFLSKDISFRKFHTLLQGHCEDRSLFLVNSCQPTRKPSHEGYRIVEDDDEDSLEPDPSLSLYYKLIIAPGQIYLRNPKLSLSLIVPYTVFHLQR